MRSMGLAGAAAAAALMLGSAGVSVTTVPDTRTVVSDSTTTVRGGQGTPASEVDRSRDQRMIHSASVAGRWVHRWPGQGWSVAQDRRNAKKARSRRRNKMAHRS